MENLRCPICQEYLPLSKGKVIINADFCDDDNNAYKVGYQNVPVFHCTRCNEDYLPNMTESVFSEILKTSVIPYRASDMTNVDVQWKDFCDFDCLFDKEFISGNVPFIIDKTDYYFIDGLRRDYNVGFLTPLFFNIEVLLKFMHHPQYSLDICSNTMGLIYHNNEHYITFGINSNNRIIIWLGDLLNLSEEEQYYFRSENVPSDHNVGSEYYEAQIEVIWAKRSIEKQVLEKRNAFNEKISELFSVNISQLDTETIIAAKKIQKLVIDSEDAFMNIIIPLNEVLVESINASGIKKYFASKAVSKDEYKEKKGIKLLQLFLKKEVPSIDVEKILCPLYVLYDFRILYAHILSEQDKKGNFEKCLQRLNIDTNTTDFTAIMSKLYDDLNQMYTDLLSAL